MISTIKDCFVSMDLYAVTSASLPLLAGLAVWLSFYIRFDQNVLKKLEWSFLRVANHADGLTKCRVENLKTLNEVASDLATPQFEAAWNKMMLQAEHRYTEEILPEGECFFRRDALITVPARRDAVRTIYGTVFVLMFLCVLLPPMLAMMTGLKLTVPNTTAGLIGAVLLLLIHLLFTALDRKSVNKTEAAYHRFLYAFDIAVPTAADMTGPALLLDATRKNQKAMEQMSDRIVKAFHDDTEKISGAIDEFANGGVLPAIQDTMRTLTMDFLAPAVREIGEKLDETLKLVTERQETGMQELAGSFAARLADTLEFRINMISDALEQYQDRMEEQNNLYQDRIDALNRLLTAQIQEMSDFMEQQKLTMERTEVILDRSEGLRRDEAANMDRFNENLDNMLTLTGQFREQTDKFAQDALLFTEKSIHTQMHFSSLVKEITERMQEAMAGAGREIAAGINQAVGDNARAIADLTVQAQALRDDYEVFFARSDESVKTTLEEMDYQVQGLITRMSEDIGTILKSAIENNGEILDQYKDQTANILSSFDEQARSISLYAKEINMDISELSANLGVSVSEFNEKMREGIQLAIGDFDQGLAELTNRIANTVESITDAVEALPARIKMGDPGR